MDKIRKGIILSVLVCLLSVSACVPGHVLAAEQQAGIAVFTDGDTDHIYAKGEPISFSMGPFPCQAGKTDYLVFGIMEKGSSDFDISGSPLEGLSNSEKGYYLPLTADSEGYFKMSGNISMAADQLPTGVLAVKIYSSDWNLLVNEKTGTEAFVPVVAADGTPALIIGKLATGQPTEPTLANSLAKAAEDNDLDQVYFHGQPIVINFTIPDNRLLSFLPVEQLTITPGVFDDANTFATAAPPLAGNFSISKTASGLKIEATIHNPDNNTLPSGVLGVKLNMPSNIPGASALQQPMPVVSSLGKAVIVGVKVPSNMFVTSNPPLAEIKNLYNTEQSITFTKGSQGSITFVPGLNIIDNRNELAALDQSVNVNYDREKQSFAFEVETGALSFLKGKSAGIKAFGVMEKLKLDNSSGKDITELINMAVVDNEGKTVPADQVGNYIDQDNVSYESSADILTIPVKHFTRYEINKKKIDIVSKVETPTFAPPPGTYKTSPKVNIQSGTPGASVRYTLDGSEPTASSTLYSSPIAIDSTTTVKAKAFKEGFSDSETATAKYEIAKQEQYKKISVSPGSISLKFNKTKKIKVKATPLKGKTVDVTKDADFISQNANVVIVENGVARAVGKGETKINVSYGGLEKVIKVKVK